LDILDVSLQAAQPHNHHQENHVIDGARWIRRGATSWAALQPAVENPKSLWVNGESSGKGTNDRVLEADAVVSPRSLYLIRPRDLRIVLVHDSYKDKYQTRAQFTHRNEDYCLSLTDPMASARFSPKQPDEETSIADALICVSLGEILHGYAYKLVASVITP
jgi:hypothetical protein